ncbi:anthrone oxygenase family protein [Mycolicibacterium sp. XJ1819]
MRQTLETIALLVTGPMVGVEIAVAVFANPVLDKLPDDGFWQARRDSGRLLGKVMPFWYIATLVALVAAAVVTWQDWLVTTAAAVMALVVLMTVTLMVPVNNRIGRWAEAGDVDRDLARHWDRLHWRRVALLIVVFALLVISV